MTTLAEELSHITDIRSLKNKRSTKRKGILKRHSNHYEDIKDVPLNQQHLADLERRLETVIDNATTYDVIQDRIEELDNEETTANEAGVIRDQLILNNKLTDAYQALIDASQAWTTGERLQDEAQDLKRAEDISGVYARQTYEQLVSNYKQFRQDIKKLAGYTELRGLKEDLDPVIQELSTRMDRELIATSPEGSVASHSDPTLERLRPFQSKLKLQLPYFSGELLQWKDFWDLFNGVIEGERLSDRENIAIYKHP